MAIKLFESRVAIHFLFILLFLGSFCSPAIFSGIPVARILNIFILGFFFLLCIYAGRWICRRWLLSTRLIRFVLYSTIAILCFSTAAIIGLKQISEDQSAGIIISVICVVAGFFLLGTFLSITRTSILRLIREASIVQHQRESELQLLRSQLSPHFLFNVLNNLYGLSMQSDKNVPGLILKLSDLLRYSIYETNHDFIPLSGELAYINNYIELERTRIGKKLSLESNIQKTGIEDIKIAPMLLIVFIENAFKHSKNTSGSNIQIRIDLHISDRNLVFEVMNSCTENHFIDNNQEGSGMGLAVTLKRLELIYQGQYTLEKSRGNGFYKVELQLKIK